MTNITQSAFAHQSAVVIPCTPATSTAPIAGQQYIYVLPTVDRSMVKIGRSNDPLDRIAVLLNTYPDIDLSRSVIVGVDTHRIEAVLHAIFSHRRMKLNKRSDGHTEWFCGDICDEVLELAQRIAQHRGIEYPVIRNVDRLLHDYRAKNPNAGKRAPRLTQVEHKIRTPHIEARLSEAIHERTQRVIVEMIHGGIDAITEHGGNSYLSRFVFRNQEPECWRPDGGHRSSDWGRQLAELAYINVAVDGGSCTFRLVKQPVFVPLNMDQGCEYFRICEARPNSLANASANPCITDGAVSEMWSALDHLQRIELPTDPFGQASNFGFTGC